MARSRNHHRKLDSLTKQEIARPNENALQSVNLPLISVSLRTLLPSQKHGTWHRMDHDFVLEYSREVKIKDTINNLGRMIYEAQDSAGVYDEYREQNRRWYENEIATIEKEYMEGMEEIDRMEREAEQGNTGGSLDGLDGSKDSGVVQETSGDDSKP